MRARSGGHDVFIAYASDARSFAASACARLEAADLSVFLDENALEGGASYDRAIREAVQTCAVFVFVISPASLAPGAYARTELDWARRARRPLNAVYAAETELDALPPELQAVTVPNPAGDRIAALVSQVGDRVRSQRASERRRTTLRACGLVAVAALVALTFQERIRAWVGRPRPAWTETSSPQLRGLDSGRDVRLLVAPRAEGVIVSWESAGKRQLRRYDFDSEQWSELPPLSTGGPCDFASIFALETGRLLALWARRDESGGLFASWFDEAWGPAERIAAFLREDDAWSLKVAADSSPEGVIVTWSELPSKGSYLLRTTRFDGKRWSVPREVAPVQSLDKPFVAMLDSGRSLTAWAEHAAGAPGQIRYQIHLPDATVAPPVRTLVEARPGRSIHLMALDRDDDGSLVALYRGGDHEGLTACRLTNELHLEGCSSVMAGLDVQYPVLETGAIDGVAWFDATPGGGEIGVATRPSGEDWTPLALERSSVAYPCPTLVRAGNGLYGLWLGHAPEPAAGHYLGWSHFTPTEGWTEAARVPSAAPFAPMHLMAIGTPSGDAMAVLAYYDLSTGQGGRPALKRRAILVH